MRRSVVFVVACLSLLPIGTAEASPIFTAAFTNTNLVADLGWSSDLGANVRTETGVFVPTGVPVTVSASAVRDGRLITSSFTQTAPYILNDQYWAASWYGTMNIPAPGFYGLFAGTRASGLWSFDIPGLTFFELINTTFYYATRWDIAAPLDIHPTISTGGGAPPLVLHGSTASSFQLAPAFFQTGNPWFGMGVGFNGSTFAQDTNLPGTMTFSYQIAFSTTPIDASVFDDPGGAAVPEPGTLLLIAGPLLGLLRHRRWPARRA